MATFRKRGCKCPPDKKCNCGATWEYQVVYRDHDGNRKSKTKGGFQRKKDAELAAAELERKINNDTFISKETQLKTFLQQWVESKRLTIKKNTLNTYQGIIDNHILPELGEEEINKMTPAQLNKLYTKLITEKKLSDSTVRDVHKVLKNVLEQALKWGMIERNPTSLIKPPRVEKKEIHTWSLDESNRFLEAAKNHPKSKRVYIAFLLALTTGMRQGEILGLRWKDLSIMEIENEETKKIEKNGVISVVQTLSHDGKELSAGAKTASGNRLISIDGQTVKELESHRKGVIYKEKIKKGPEYHDNDLVIPASTGKPLTPRNLMRTFYNLIDQVNDEEKKKEKPKLLPKISFHDLRHTHATLLLKKGVNLKIVSERLGHSSIRITSDLYSHVTPDIQRDAAKVFGEMFYS